MIQQSCHTFSFKITGYIMYRDRDRDESPAVCSTVSSVCEFQGSKYVLSITVSKEKIYISNIFSKFRLIRKEVLAGSSLFSDAIFLGHIGSDPHLMSHEQHSHHGREREKILSLRFSRHKTSNLLLSSSVNELLLPLSG